MTSNLPEKFSANWVNTDIVMPVNTNKWESSINSLIDATKIYASTGDFYVINSTSSGEDSLTLNLVPCSHQGVSNETLSEYREGMKVHFLCTSTGDSSKDVNVKIGSLSSVVVKDPGSGLQIKGNEIVQGYYISLVYNSLNSCFYLDITNNVNKYVRKTGDSMTGNLAVEKSDPNIYLIDTAQTAGTIPGSNLYEGIYFQDKNGTSLGLVGNIYGADGGRYSYMSSTKGDGTGGEQIRIGYHADGTIYTFAPKPNSVTDNSNAIATTSHIIDVLKLIYPVGSIYIGTQATCPLASLFGTWKLVSKNRALWTGNGANANTTIAAGLPNITGTITFEGTDGGGSSTKAFTTKTATGAGYYHHSKEDNCKVTFSFDASKGGSTIFGQNTTVQPPAYVVNVWRRTA